MSKSTPFRRFVEYASTFPPTRGVRWMNRGSTTSSSSAPLVEHVELRPLVAARVDLHEHAPVGQEEARDRLREIRQLLELAAARRQRVELMRSRDVRRDEQPRAVGRERERHCLPHLEQRTEVAGAGTYAATPENSGMISSP